MAIQLNHAAAHKMLPNVAGLTCCEEELGRAHTVMNIKLTQQIGLYSIC